MIKQTLFITLLLASAWAGADTAKKSSDPDLTYKNLASRLCGLYIISNSLLKDSKDIIFNFISKKEGIAQPSVAQVLRYLNQHKNEMRCHGKHFVAYSFERYRFNEIIDDLFYADENLYTETIKYDFNSIVPTKNPTTKKAEPMTILDYINKVALVRTDISGDATTNRQIEEIRELIIEEFGAKRFVDLTDAEVRADYPYISKAEYMKAYN